MIQNLIYLGIRALVNPLSPQGETYLEQEMDKLYPNWWIDDATPDRHEPENWRILIIGTDLVDPLPPDVSSFLDERKQQGGINYWKVEHPWKKHFQASN